MENVLLKYMDYRFHSKTQKASFLSGIQLKSVGPVITVSREAGCSGNQFVKELATFLSSINTEGELKQKWQWVNKEIIYETANELQVHPNRVYKLFKGEPRRLMDEIVESLSTRYYVNDKVITKAIHEIVKRFAAQGHMIILGRGGVGLTRHMEKSLHIKLYAPREWRLKQIEQKLNLSNRAAQSFLDKTDDKRNKLIERFNRIDFNNTPFDLSFNCKSLKFFEMFNAIKGVLQARELQ